MTEHINSAFDTGLKEVNKQIAKLGALAEREGKTLIGKVKKLL